MPDVSVSTTGTSCLRAKVGPNQIHLHLTSTSPEHQQSTVARALELGGRHLDVGQTPRRGTSCSPTRRATSSASSSRATPSSPTAVPRRAGLRRLAGGRALLERCPGWPLVWDQDQETAIQSPPGREDRLGWSTRATEVRTNRMHFHLAPAASGDRTRRSSVSSRSGHRLTATRDAAARARCRTATSSALRQAGECRTVDCGGDFSLPRHPRPHAPRRAGGADARGRRAGLLGARHPGRDDGRDRRARRRHQAPHLRLLRLEGGAARGDDRAGPGPAARRAHRLLGGPAAGPGT